MILAIIAVMDMLLVGKYEIVRVQGDSVLC